MNTLKHIQAGHSPNIERKTPRYIFEGLQTTFDLDPCSGKEHCPAKEFCHKSYVLPQDGLLLPWSGRVWLNPPFARNVVGAWVAKAKQHNNAIVLVTSYFTSRWFQDNPPDGLLLLAKRPRYEGIVPKDKSTIEGRYASMLMSYGGECTEILSQAKLEGHFYTLGS
jgi:hypothetical protein